MEEITTEFSSGQRTKRVPLERLPCPNCKSLSTRAWSCSVNKSKTMLLKFYVCKNCGYEYCSREIEFKPKGFEKHKAGSANNNAKLTEESVRSIRIVYDAHYQKFNNFKDVKTIALMHTIKTLSLEKIHRETIRKICTRKSWKHVVDLELSPEQIKEQAEKVKIRNEN